MGTSEEQAVFDGSEKRAREEIKEICKSQSISNLPLSLEGKVMFSAHFVSAVEFCSRFCLGKKATLELIALGFGGTVVLSDVQSHMSNCSVGY